MILHILFKCIRVDIYKLELLECSLKSLFRDVPLLHNKNVSCWCSLSVLPTRIKLLANNTNNNNNKQQRNCILDRCLCIDDCFNNSPDELVYEAISWDIYNLEYGSPKSRASKFHVINRLMPKILEQMTVYERTELIKLVLKQQDRRVRLGMDDFGISHISLLNLQSEEIDAGASITDNANTIIASSGKEECIVRYLDETPGTLVEHKSLSDKTFSGDFVSDHSLVKFLARPVVISTLTWAEGAYLNTTLQPWDLFFNSTQIKKKIDNYARLTCNLHVKVILNASPFYYGAGLVSYQPLTAFNPSTISANLTLNDVAQTCALSQRPHFWIYPQTCQGGEIVLPFLNYRTWLNIGSRADVQNFGSLTLTSPVALLNSNSVVGTGATIQIYAWASDVKICAPTVALALQAGEYGAISGPASAVANIASKLSSIPMIGPYAKATEMLASGIGSIAKLFGFTNAPIMEDVKPIKNLPFHAFSSCEVSNPIDKLSLDPKNELTIDSRVCGHDGMDELLIKNFIQRESFVMFNAWSAAHPAGQVLIRANVTPDTKATQTVIGVPHIQGTPMSHVNSLFRYWRGDIIYRFRFICSKFHRGRVMIQWDPQASLTSAAASNLIHTQIVDISSDTDVEFRVPYMNNQLFSRNSGSNASATSFNTVNIAGSGAIDAYNQTFHNGMLCLSVLTQQTSPIASAEIWVLVSVRADENMVFGMPQSPPKELSPFELQSEDFTYDQTEHFDLTSKPSVLDDETFLICMGERVTSLRQLMRRTTLHRSSYLNTAPSTTTMTYCTSNHARLPLWYGYDPNGINSGTSAIASPAQVPFNFVNNSAISWISSCFVGYRGSVNWHYNVEDNLYVNNIKTGRYNGGTITAGDYRLSNSPSILSTSAFARGTLAIRTSGGLGSAVFNSRTQTGISSQYPQFSMYRMQSTNATTLVLGSSVDESDLDHCRVELTQQPHTAANIAIPAMDYFVSCGTDYTCIFFLNVPTVIYNPLPGTVP